MKRLDIFKSIKTRITFWFMIIALLPLLLALVITYKQRVSAIQEASFQKLSAIRDLKVSQLENWLAERHSDMHTMSAESELESLEMILDDQPSEQVLNKRLVSIQQVINSYLIHFSAYNEIFIINPSNGKILLSTNEARNGKDVSEDDFFKEPLVSRELAAGDIFYSKSLGKPSMISSIPIFCNKHGGDHIIGILVARFDLDHSLYNLLLDRVGLGTTGETLLIDKNAIALNELRWHENAPLNLKISADPAVYASQGKTGIIMTNDYRGEPVLAAYTNIPETGWGFVCKQDLYELNAPIREMIANFLYLFGISAIMIYFVATYLAKSISRPIVQMAELSTKITRGDFSQRIELSSQDEVGSLSASINDMSDSIQRRVVVQNGVRNISDILITGTTLQEYASELIIQLMEVTGATSSSFYILNELHSEFEHLSSIGGNPDLMPNFSSKNPEGEFGAAITQKKIVHLRDIPDDTRFTFLTTSGKAIPREIITIPILAEGTTIALISLVNIHPFSDSCSDILEQTWLSINISYSKLMAEQRTQVLAENLSHINQQLEAQSEELQQQTEELQEQTEELETTTERLQDQNIELDVQRRQVEEANRLKSEFLSNMSHELRTPLNSVLALSNVLLDQTRDRLTGDESNYLEIIVRNGRQLLKLINDILNLSKIEAGQMEVITSNFSLRGLIHDIIDSLKPLADENGNNLEVNLADDLQEIISDQTLVHGILQNLISNAVKFTHQGKILINGELHKDKMVISIQDTGIGISEEALPHVFEEFRQGDGTTSRQYEGTGLGLTIANRSAHLIGGALDAESRLGEGSTFTLTLPIKFQEMASLEPVVIPAESIQTSTRKVLGRDSIRLLVVEDQEPAIIQLKSILEPIGYTLDVAQNGEEALNYLKNNLPDGIILDLMLPGVDGFAVLRSVRQNQSSNHVPILILSSKSLTGDERRMLHYNNIQELIRKGDVSKTDLINKIGAMLHLETQAAQVGKAEKRHASEASPTILIIEDDQDSLISLKAILDDDYRLLEARDGEQGWALFQAETPDLVLLDMILPKMDGYEIARKAKAHADLKVIPIIAISGRAMPRDTAEILAAGCDISLSKPIDIDVLKENVKRCLN
ncbi:MAG: response regulator [Candidatus Marinimicrobia bacterium]|nr:response regulator [Candidatus Neomarinimicrobiota bacterium]